MDRQFPPEIIQIIVEASLQPFDPFTAPSTEFVLRYSTLKPYSLLNSTWRDVSRPLLRQSCQLGSEASLRSFLEIARSENGMMEEVQKLFIHMHNVETLDMSKLRCTPHLISLGIGDCDELSLDDLAQFQKLQELALIQVNMVVSPASPPLRLPCLRHLVYSCYSLDRDQPAFPSLKSETFPQLRYLQILHVIPPDITTLLPQLEAIRITPELPALLPAAKSLQLLELPCDPSTRLDMLSRLPSLPPFLFLDFATHHALDPELQFRRQQVRDALEQLADDQRAGHRVILLRKFGIDETVEVVISRLRQRAIQVVVVETQIFFSGAIAEMERILAEENKKRERDGMGMIREGAGRRGGAVVRR